jgi:hypothetical protein
MVSTTQAGLVCAKRTRPLAASRTHTAHARVTHRRWGMEYKGYLVSVDAYMNLQVR